MPSPLPAVDTLIQDIEDGIVALLAPLVAAGFEVAALPETKNGIDAATVAPKLWATYRESTTDADQPPLAGLGDNVAQREILHYDITVLARGRRNDRGTYAVMNAARRLLIGQVPAPGADRLMFTGQRIEEFEAAGTWRYSLSVSCTTILVADIQDDEAGAEIESLLLYWKQGN